MISGERGNILCTDAVIVATWFSVVRGNIHWAMIIVVNRTGG
jgi:hypothetical protein